MEKTNKIIEIFKKDSILIISGLLAVISCIFVKPDMEYVGYINFRVLAILFSLMLVVSAYIRIGTFDFFTNKLLGKIRSEKYISLFLVMLSFFMSMLLYYLLFRINGSVWNFAIFHSFNICKIIKYRFIK